MIAVIILCLIAGLTAIIVSAYISKSNGFWTHFDITIPIFLLGLSLIIASMHIDAALDYLINKNK